MTEPLFEGLHLPDQKEGLSLEFCRSLLGSSSASTTPLGPTLRFTSLVLRSDRASKRHSNKSVARSNRVSITYDSPGRTSRMLHCKGSWPGIRVVPCDQRRR